MKKIVVYRKLTEALVLFTLLWSAGIVLAQGYDSVGANGYLGLRVGYLELEKIEDEGSANFGLYGGVFLAPYLAIEGSVDWQEGEVYIEGDNYTVRVPVLDRETTALQAGLKLMPVQDGDFRPYLSGGVGYYVSHYVDRRGFYAYHDDHIDEGGFYAGGGLELFGRGSDARGFTFTWDTRWLFTEKEAWRDDDHVKADGWVSSLGCTFRF